LNIIKTLRDLELRSLLQAIIPDDENLLKKSNPNRIKSWEYDKWDKLDIEAELTKLEVTDMQINEWKKFQKPKLQAEQKNVELLMRNEEKLIRQSEKSSKDKHSTPSDRSKTSSDKPSFIEELPTLENKGPISISKADQQSKEVKPKRRFKIQIDDVNMGY